MGQNATIHAKDDSAQDSLGRDTWQPLKSTAGALHTTATGAGGVSSGTATLSNVSAAATSTALLAANSARKGVMIHNDSASIMYIAYGATASATAHSVKLYPGDQWAMPLGYTGAINGIWASAVGAARITEL